jgi:hypothetical protein
MEIFLAAQRTASTSLPLSSSGNRKIGPLMHRLAAMLPLLSKTGATTE